MKANTILISARTSSNYMDPNYYSQEGIATQRQIFESHFAPYFGEEFLRRGENYPSNWVVHPIPTPGDAVVIIISQGMRGYQVYLGGRDIGTKGTGGDLSNARFSFKVLGGRYHYIRVYDGQFNYPKKIFFRKGEQKIIYAESGQMVL
jgi:hypothetical protein